MASLQISLFGSFQIRWDGNADTPTLSPIVQALFSYLLINRHRTHPREVLANLLWGDYSHQQAHNCLNTAVWRLRHVLEPQGIPAGTYLLSTPLGELGFNAASDYWLDVDVFEEQARRTLACPLDQVKAEEVQALRKAMQLYIGELLEGHYDDWALRERERLRCYYLNCLNYMMNYCANHSLYETSLEYGRQLLCLDALHEDVHRQMMRLYLKTGQRALAVRQYEQCRQVLCSELGIPPMAETQELYQSILQDSPQTPKTPVLNPSNQPVSLGELQSALNHLDRAQHELQQVTSAVKKIVEHDG